MVVIMAYCGALLSHIRHKICDRYVTNFTRASGLYLQIVRITCQFMASILSVGKNFQHICERTNIRSRDRYRMVRAPCATSTTIANLFASASHTNGFLVQFNRQRKPHEH